MNIIYYLVGTLNKETSVGCTGGHGYTYDSDVKGRKSVKKNVATPYGYFVNSDYQSESVVVEGYLNGRAVGKDSIQALFLKHMDALLDYYLANKGDKLLLVTNMPKVTKSFVAGTITCEDGDLVKRVLEKYDSVKDNIIVDYPLYPKAGLGTQHAHNQCRISEMILKHKPEGEVKLNYLSEKEFSEPTVEFNNLVTASRWYFNTGSNSRFNELTSNGRRAYHFGKVEPDKNYYGKATPDVYYSALYAKEPVPLLDKLYEFCKLAKGNDLNLLLAGNLNNIKSKEVARTIDDIPGEFTGNTLISPMRIRVDDEPGLVDYINPPGLSYRISEFLEELDDLYKVFLKRDEVNPVSKIKFMDITDHLFTFDDGKVKIHPEFVQTTLQFKIMIESPDCVKPVKLSISPRYDMPDRNSFNSLIKEKITDIKVYLILDFCDTAGFRYSTLTSTPDFDYLHSNSIANLRVYNLRELGRSKEE